MSIKSRCSVALLSAMLLAACSSSNGGSPDATGAAGSGGGGTGGSDLPVVAACKAFCQAEKDCNSDTTLDDCYSYRCTDVSNMLPFPQQPASCQNAYKAFYDCLAHQTTICDPINPNMANIPGSCTTQADALGAANCMN
jgi:hypothetical protein